jgi:single-strand DNA-binding protein
MAMNVVTLVGRLTKDPESRTVGESMTTSFTVAVDRPFKTKNGDRETDFIPVVTWRKTAEICAQYLTKGREVAVRGSLHIRSYTDREGAKRSATEVVADEVSFIGGRKDAAPGAVSDMDTPDWMNEYNGTDVPF